MFAPQEFPKLDRFVEFDDRSRAFPMRALLPQNQLRSYTWRCRQWLNQGREGACVGFGWTHELIARPGEVPGLDESVAQSIYRTARTLDQWPGENYDGTSVIAGIKAVQQLHPGKITEYRWCFGLSDVLLTLGYHGPVVLGLNWYQGMFLPDPSGLIRVNGAVAGGHCILATGYDRKTELIRLHNSWGPQWGKGGDCFIGRDDLSRLLQENGEACVAVQRAPEKRRAA